MHAPPSHAAIALGSNVGDRATLISNAIELIATISNTVVLRSSQLLQTTPVAAHGAPADLGGPYLNGAAIVQTGLGPRQLLEALLQIERRLGRTRDPANRSGPRTIDLDLVLYGDLVVDEPGLTLPHPRMHLRRFVLEPLAEIAPDWVVPTLGQTVRDLLRQLPGNQSADAANNQV
jgi:2-amino-4-hydroxy-6-hydroxymethyldihydropteridine diphosphokinase